MALHPKNDLESLILSVVNEKKEFSLHELAHQAGITIGTSSERRAVQRVVAKLVAQGVILAKGNARARVYISGSPEKPDSERVPHQVFAGIPLSKQSTALLQYVLQPLQLRKPVGYNQHFLNSYTPDQTFYLSQPLLEELHSIGKVEIVERAGGTYARNILNRLLIDLSWNSSRLEGNTYSLLETRRLIELGENVAGKDVAEAQMILNHKDAIEYIVESAQDSTISSYEVRSIHALLSDNLLGDPGASGRVRELVVGISGTTYLPLENPHVLKECFEIFIKKMNCISDPFEQSFFALVHLSYMQAFEDVNKRTARLVSNIPLIRQNLNPLSFTDVNQTDYVQALLGIYEKNDVSLLRDLYIWAYKRSAHRYSALQQSLVEPDLFKIKHRHEIQIIIRTIILEKVAGPELVSTIRLMIDRLSLPVSDAIRLMQMIETEVMSLHDGNIARFKIRPSEFQAWKERQ